MSNIGKFLKKHFQNMGVELSTDMTHEWVNYADSSMINHAVIVGIFVDYDEESGVLILVSAADSETKIYIPEDSVKMFWAAGVGKSMMGNIKTLMGTGNKSFKKRDIM